VRLRHPDVAALPFLLVISGLFLALSIISAADFLRFRSFQPQIFLRFRSFQRQIFCPFDHFGASSIDRAFRQFV
jgi:hypothetical protein